jgi:hypothetical protein
MKVKECYLKTVKSAFDEPQEGGWTEYEGTQTLDQEGFDKLPNSEKSNYQAFHYKEITRTMSVYAWENMAIKKYQKEYTKGTHEFYVVKTHKETKIKPDDDYKYTEEVRREYVNVLDEHGQVQLIESSDTLEQYKIRYLTKGGVQITEDQYNSKMNAGEEVFVAAFVGCTYHCG